MASCALECFLNTNAVSLAPQGWRSPRKLKVTTAPGDPVEAADSLSTLGSNARTRGFGLIARRAKLANVTSP